MGKIFDEMLRLLDSGTRNIIQSANDEFCKQNAELRAKAGLEVVIIRESLGECCSWCSDLEGVYSYETAPEDVYARHRDCNCVVSTRTKKGTFQDAWSKKEFKTYKENRIAREKEIIEETKTKRINNINAKTAIKEEPPFSRNVYPEYIRNAKPGEGQVIREKGYNEIQNEKEIQIADLLHRELGGDIKLLKEDTLNREKRPDYEWNGKLWDLKTPKNAKNGISKRTQTGLEQIKTNPGGVIIDLDSCGATTKEAIKILNGRMKLSNKFTTDIILIKNKKIAKIIRYY